MTLGEKIKFLRKQKNITQSEFADKLYVTRQAVQKWEVNLSTPDIDKIKDIAKMFNITIDDLLNDEIDELSLINILNKDKIEKKEQSNTANKSKSMLDIMLLIPFSLGIFICIGMGYMMITISLIFLIAMAIVGPIYGIFSLVNIFIVNDSLHILISIGFTIIGLGMGLPFAQLSKLYYEKAKSWIKYLNNLTNKVWKGVLSCFKN